MYNFVFMLKTYLNDWDFTARLVETYEKHNKDDIPLFIVIPGGEEYELFRKKYASKKNIVVLCENKINVQYAKEEVNGTRPGYINQEIVKLAFWELGLCKNYMCLDADGWFLRDFFIDDFMYDDEVPYTALIEDNDLKANPNYYNAFWIEREKRIKIIQEKLGYSTKHLLTCHGFQIFNTYVLKKLKVEYMIPNNLTYLDLMKISAYEFSWYNIWLQKSQAIPIHICEPWFKCYHMAYQQFGEVITDVNEKTLGRAYVGVTICSFERDWRVISVKDIDKIYYPIRISMILKILHMALKNCARRGIKRIKKIKGMRRIIKWLKRLGVLQTDLKY